MSNNKIKILEVMEEVAKSGVKIKILTRIEIPGLNNILDVLSINDKVGREVVEIRHTFQPLRATIVDDKIITLKEEKSPLEFRGDELKEGFSIILKIYDEEWLEWLQKIFWNLFRTAIPAQKRVQELEDIRSIK